MLQSTISEDNFDQYHLSQYLFENHMAELFQNKKPNFQILIPV